MLLPMNEASAREQSLSSHLALVACRDGHGNGHLFNGLMRTVYIVWFLHQDGYGSEPVGERCAADDATAVDARDSACGDVLFTPRSG